MNNYNIEIDLLKIDGARPMEVLDGGSVRPGVWLPIDNRKGTVTCLKDGVIMLSMTALEQPHKVRGQSHLIKVHLNRETFDQMSRDERRQLSWIGNLRPWNKPGEDAGADW